MKQKHEQNAHAEAQFICTKCTNFNWEAINILLYLYNTNRV